MRKVIDVMSRLRARTARAVKPAPVPRAEPVTEQDGATKRQGARWG